VSNRTPLQLVLPPNPCARLLPTLFPVVFTPLTSFPRLDQLTSISSQRLENYRRIDPEGFEVLMYIRKNKDKFKMEILEPPIVSITVPRQEYSHAVESCFSFVQLKVSYVSALLFNSRTLSLTSPPYLA
jgi:hypothetical protein